MSGRRDIQTKIWDCITKELYRDSIVFLSTA
jgi:hypothetical protein